MFPHLNWEPLFNIDRGMIKVLFVCTGNICRSPTAEGVFAHKIKAAGLTDKIGWDSAGTHGYHVGAAPDPRSSAAAMARGYDLSGLKARQVTFDDFEDFDLLLCMDYGHLATLQGAAPADLHGKIHMFDDKDVGDPYYGDNGFDTVLDQIEAACDRWIAQLKTSL